MSSHPPRNPDPQISANGLAEFLVSSHTAQLRILRQYVFEDKSRSRMIRYDIARKAIRQFLIDPQHNALSLTKAKNKLSARSSSLEKHIREDAVASLDALKSALQMTPLLNSYRFDSVPEGVNRRKINFSGVDVSVYADLLVYPRGGKTNAVGAAILRVTKDSGSITTRKDMGLFAATLVAEHAKTNLVSGQPVSPSLCIAIDIQHGKIFATPPSNTRRMQRIKSACHIIAAAWHSIPP